MAMLPPRDYLCKLNACMYTQARALTYSFFERCRNFPCYRAVRRNVSRRGEAHARPSLPRDEYVFPKSVVRLNKRHITVLASSSNCLVSAQHLTRNKLYTEASIGIARTARIIHWILISPSVRAICMFLRRFIDLALYGYAR